MTFDHRAARRELHRRPPRHLRRQLAPGRAPGREPAVEDRHLRVSEVVEHPPQAGGRRPADVVVGDDEMLRSDAQLAEARGQVGRAGEWMAAGALRRREDRVVVDEDRAGDVAGLVLGRAAIRLSEVPANVGDPDRIVAVVEARQELGGGDQGHRVRMLSCRAAPRRRPRPPDGGPSLRRSSVVERAAVNRLVVGSSPTAGAKIPVGSTLFGTDLNGAGPFSRPSSAPGFVGSNRSSLTVSHARV